MQKLRSTGASFLPEKGCPRGYSTHVKFMHNHSIGKKNFANRFYGAAEPQLFHWLVRGHVKTNILRSSCRNPPAVGAYGGRSKVRTNPKSCPNRQVATLLFSDADVVRAFLSLFYILVSFRKCRANASSLSVFTVCATAAVAVLRN